MTRPLVLVIEDNVVDQERIRRWLGKDHALVFAGTAEQGLAEAFEQDPDCVLLDYLLPDAAGIDLVPTLELLAPVVVMTGQAEVEAGSPS